MAKKIQVELEAKTDKAIKEIKDVKGEIQNLTKSTEEGFKDVGDATKGVSKGIKGIGTALKAAGIGLVVAAFAQLTEIFKQNQKVADVFNTTFEALSLAFNDFVNFVVGNAGAVVNTFKAFFQDPLQGIKNLGNAIKENIIERFTSALEAIGFLGDAIVKVFKGDFAGAAESAKNAGKELIDVVTGVDDSFDKTTQAVSNYVGETVKAAKANVELGKQAEIARVRQQGVIESFDLQAEKLRQIRDEERNTIDERIAANNKLKETLDEQEAAMLANVDALVAAAQAEFDKNQNQENTIALLEAQQEKEAVLAQIAGFRSEQLSNDLALNREKLELEQSISDAESERAINEARFTAEQIENEYVRLQALKDVNEQERQIEVQRLTEKRNAYKQGTQAFQDAQNELLAFQSENANQQKQIEKDLAIAKQQEVTNALGNIAGIVGQNSKFGKAIAIVQAIRDTYTGANKALAQGGLFGFIGAAAVVAGGLANVKAITSTQDPTAPSFAQGGGRGAPSVSVPTATPPTPPAFNIVGASDTNQLAEAIGGQAQQPVKAYVVSNDVSTAQELDRNIVEGASIG
jgi:hypothetical protein